MSEHSLYPHALFHHRRAGVLLHPTALPGPGNNGDLGPAAYDFIDFLAAAGASIWQMLPLGPVNASGSPYQSPSLLAGDPRLISPERLADDGLLDAHQIQHADRQRMLADALRHCRSRPDLMRDWEAFREHERYWLDDFILFSALHEALDRRPWWQWPRGLRDRHPRALADARREFADACERLALGQYLFERQWRHLARYAHELDVHLFGDLPMYPALDSTDVWAARQYFQLDADGRPRFVAGVPPDLFSDTGQRWGNPVYAWDRHAADDFAWWRQRIAIQQRRFELLRLDHFRGLDAYWAIPSREATADTGSWQPAPGRGLLRSLARLEPRPALVAEDLGVITATVEKLRDDFHLPSTRVLQFAFDGDPDNPHLPANHPTRCVAYTGTHDNDTLRGWWQHATGREQHRAANLIENGTAPEGLIDVLLASPARLAILPMQDLLDLGSEARFNTPGTSRGNWHWRLQHHSLQPQDADGWRIRFAAAGRTLKH